MWRLFKATCTGKKGKSILFAHDGQAILLGGSLHFYYPSSLAFFGGRFGLGQHLSLAQV